MNGFPRPVNAAMTRAPRTAPEPGRTRNTAIRLIGPAALGKVDVEPCWLSVRPLEAASQPAFSNTWAGHGCVRAAFPPIFTARLPGRSADLAVMLDALQTADELYRPSPFWERLAIEHVAQLEKDGFENFKRTVNLKYFNWGMLGIFAHHILPLGAWWLTSGRGNPLKARIVENGPGDKIFGWPASRVYATHVDLLYQRVRQEDKTGVFERCSESPIGNPIQVRVADGTTTTQDLCNSIHEYIRASQFTCFDTGPKRVLEIGAGYGRLASVFLNADPGTKYWIVDIPPAPLRVSALSVRGFSRKEDIQIPSIPEIRRRRRGSRRKRHLLLPVEPDRAASAEVRRHHGLHQQPSRDDPRADLTLLSADRPADRRHILHQAVDALDRQGKRVLDIA